MKPKKVAILYAGAAHWGGIETYLEQLFINIDKNKLDLTLVSIGKSALFEKLAEMGFKTRVFDNKWYDYALIVRLARYLRSENFHLVTGQVQVANFYARTSALLAHIPNLITIHSDYKYDYHGFKRFLAGASFYLLEPLTKHYVVVSNFLKREAMKLGVKENKITVIYNGVKEVSVVRKERSGTVVFGSLGRLHYKKGYQGLIRAVDIIRDLDFKVYIWGSGEDQKELEKMIDSYDLSDKVFLKGFTMDISKALSETDIYIQPSLEEGFGITVAEGMYAERPVIVTPAGSLPELITDGKTGLITRDFSPEAIAAAMKTLIENEDLSNRLAKAGREEALERFGLDKWIEAIEKAYLGAAK